MLVGILSDTHNNLPAMAAAMAALGQKGVQYYIHCGDVGSTRILDYLAGERAAFVWGNCDYDRVGLRNYAGTLGVTCLEAFGELELGGKRFAVLHGDDHRLKARVLAEQKHDYLLQGHTHMQADEKTGRTRLINPGALHRAREKTVAVLDTESDKLEYLRIDESR